MGLFGTTKTKTFVGTSVSRVVGDDAYEDPLKQALFTYMGGSAKRLSSAFQGSLLKGLASKMASYYRYGTDTYLYGAPKGSIVSQSTAAAEVKAAIETELGATITLDYSVFGFLNYAHLAWKEVDDVQGYDVTTNTLGALSTLKGVPVYLDAVHVGFPEAMIDALPPEALTLTGGNSITVTEYAGTTPISVVIDYHFAGVVWDPGTMSWVPSTVEESLTITSDLTVPDFGPEQDFFHARYVVAGATHYWIYRMGEGTHPALDSYFDEGFTANGSYYPWLYLRFGGIQVNADPDTDWYKQTKHLCNKLSINLDSLADAIAVSPNIGEVIQAMLWFAVPPNTTHRAELKYLWAYFNEAYSSQGGEFTGLSRAAFKAAFTPAMVKPYGSLIQDAQFAATLTHGGIWKRLVTGSLGPVGTLQSDMENFTVSSNYPNDSGGIQTQYTGYSLHYYSKQVSETQYEEIQVLDLSTSYNVYQFYWSIGDGDENAPIILIPLDKAIMDTLSFRDRDEVFTRGMQLVFNSMVQVKLKWYEQDWFQIVMIVVAVVISVLSVGQAAKPMADVIALITGGKYIAAFKLLFKVVLKRLLIMRSIKLIIKELGIDNVFAAVLAVVAMAIRGVSMEGLKAVAFGLEKWVTLTLSVIKEANNFIQDMQVKVMDEMAALDEEYRQKFDKLADLQDELYGGSKWAHYLIAGETPESFFARSMNPADMQVLLTSADLYVDRMLRLPYPNGASI